MISGSTRGALSHSSFCFSVSHYRPSYVHRTPFAYTRTITSLDARASNTSLVTAGPAQLAAESVQQYAGQPEAVAELQNTFSAFPNALSDPKWQVEVTQAAFPYELDQFQIDALRALASGRSVVLSAPTGAGKTIVGEMAVYLALARRLRVFYTTPLKALSNQKFSDFRRQFGEERVGLLTGDVTVNRDADVVVMTTEVYRNMLYGGGYESDNVTLLTDNLFAVVFDEFHYLNDRDRGTVWEESVINSPDHVLLVALSATMSNTADVRDWFASVQGPTELIQTYHRPVPLRFAFCNRDGVSPLFANDGKEDKGKSRKKGFEKQPQVAGSLPKLHPKLLRGLQETAVLRDSGRNGDRRRSRSSVQRLSKALNDSKSLDRLIKSFRAGSRDNQNSRGRSSSVPSFPFVVRALQRRDMLPCIVFIFSRAGCDRAAVAAAEERTSLVNDEERAELAQRLALFAEQHPGLVQQERIELAALGIASHHAGLLPLWKLCVEELFQDGLIKVVFATETLAAGINMPARTTVISALSKRAGAEGIVSLTTSEVLQMAGRAGRRGKDVLGHSVILRSRFEGVLEAFRVVTADVDELKSQFMPTYGMVLNLLQTRSLQDAKKLIDRSFGNFLQSKRASESSSRDDAADEAPGRDAEQQALELVLAEARDILSNFDVKEVRSYAKCLERVKAEKRALSYLMTQSKEQDTSLFADTLVFAPAGTRLKLRQPRPRGTSKGAIRRRRKRSYNEALAAARAGDKGEELRTFYLTADGEDEAWYDDAFDDTLSEPEGVVDAILLDMHSESIGALPMFAAIDAEGSLRLFNHMHVDRVFFDDEAMDFDNILPSWREVALPERSTWNHMGQEQYTADIPDDLGALVARVVERHEQNRRDEDLAKQAFESSTAADDAEQHPEVHAQRRRVEDSIRMVQEHALHASGEGRKVLRAKQAQSHIEVSLAEYYRKAKRQARRARNKRGQSDHDEDEESMQIDGGNWGEFMSIVSLLQHYGFVDDEYGVTSMGEIGAKVRAENELWTSLVVMHPSLEDISPVHLGAVLAATQVEGGRSDTYISYQPAEDVVEAAAGLLPLRSRLEALQVEYGIDFALSLDVELTGIVGAWASGTSWLELLSNTSLQEGDVCRVLRRVLDLLRQIPHLPGVAEKLKKNAKRSIALLDRFPVTDDLTYAVRDNEKLYEQQARDSEDVEG